MPATPAMLLLVTRRVRGDGGRRARGRRSAPARPPRRVCCCSRCSPSPPRSPTTCCPRGCSPRRPPVSGCCCSPGPARRPAGRQWRPGAGAVAVVAAAVVLALGAGAAAGGGRHRRQVPEHRRSGRRPRRRDRAEPLHGAARGAAAEHADRAVPGHRPAPAHLPAGADAEHLRPGRGLAGAPPRTGHAADRSSCPARTSPGDRASVGVENVGFRDYWLPVYGVPLGVVGPGRRTGGATTRSAARPTAPARSRSRSWTQEALLPAPTADALRAADGDADGVDPAVPQHGRRRPAGRRDRAGDHRGRAHRVRPGRRADGVVHRTGLAVHLRPVDGAGQRRRRARRVPHHRPARLLRAVRVGDGGDAAHARRAGPGRRRLHRGPRGRRRPAR